MYILGFLITPASILLTIPVAFIYKSLLIHIHNVQASSTVRLFYTNSGGTSRGRPLRQNFQIVLFSKRFILYNCFLFLYIFTKERHKFHSISIVPFFVIQTDTLLILKIHYIHWYKRYISINVCGKLTRHSNGNS